jgi:transcriptional regulator with XRE-family HTH domain
MALADRIKLRRTQKGITAAELARAAGISKGYLSEIESADPDKPVRPSADVLYRVATVLGTSVADLLEKEVRPAPREISASLRVFAEKNGLPEQDVQMLANIRFRGAQPEDERDWAFLYDAIRRSVRG